MLVEISECWVCGLNSSKYCLEDYGMITVHLLGLQIKTLDMWSKLCQLTPSNTAMHPCSYEQGAHQQDDCEA
jgi:hypothetical protein